MRILFVCTGNTCRSPMAAGLMRLEAAKRGWDDIEVESAGTDAYEGASITEGSVMVAREAGVDIQDYEARRLRPEMVQRADLIIAMARAHQAVARDMGGTDVRLLSDFGPPDGPIDVPDPFGGGLAVYRGSFMRLEKLVAGLVKHLEARRQG